MTRAQVVLLLFVACCAVAHLYCLQLAGGGTDTETGGVKVYGVMVDSAGTAKGNVEVSLIPADYNPLSDAGRNAILTDTTDADGGYAFAVRIPGIFNLQSKSLVEQKRSLISGISVEKRPVSLPADTLHTTGTIKVLLPDSPDSLEYYVYIPGTTFFSRVENDMVIIDSVPAGFIPALYYTQRNDSSTVQVIRVGASITAGDTSTIADYHKWNFSQKLFLNTTASGADVASSVCDIPILVRLTAQHFSFNEAASDGRDVRFTKPNGAPLFHEIELWDPSRGTAAIWVLVDTIRGNDDTQYIIIHWGNPSAANVSNGARVFDTGCGFAAVWHLAENSGTTFNDATANGWYGISGGSASEVPDPVPGMIGDGRQFNGTSQGIAIPNSGTGTLDYPHDGRFTLSAWVFFNRPDSSYHPIVCKGDFQWGLQIKDTNRWEIFVFDKNMYYCTRHPAVAGEWKFVTGIRDSEKIALYIDGELVIDSIIELPWPPTDTSRGVYIGSYPERRRYWNGTLDEVRVQSRVVSEHWIRLCYMNQRRDDKLVVFAR